MYRSTNVSLKLNEEWKTHLENHKLVMAFFTDFNERLKNSVIIKFINRTSKFGWSMLRVYMYDRNENVNYEISFVCSAQGKTNLTVWYGCEKHQVHEGAHCLFNNFNWSQFG